MDIQPIISAALFKDSKLIEQVPIITIDNKVVATYENAICISGLPKSRKTTFISYFIAAAILKKPIFNISVNIQTNDKIVLIDTEQSIYDFTKQISFLKYNLKAKNVPDQLKAYLFRKYEPNVILECISEIMKEHRPKILILDNTTELVYNPNDMVESKKLIQFIKLITTEYNCIVICLLHLSKSNLTTLGNIGSYMDRMAQTVLKVTMDKETGYSTMEANLMRSDSFFNPITIGYNENLKNYEQINSFDHNKKPKKFNMVDFSDKDHINRLGSIFNNIDEITYTELIEELKRIYGVGTNISKQQILPYLRTNRLIKQNKNLNYTLWKKNKLIICM